MCHVIDEIILYFTQLLLPEYTINSKYKGHKQHERKNERRYHKPDGAEYVIVQSREMNLHQTHFCGRVILEKYSCIRYILTFIIIVRTTVHLFSIFIHHGKMICDINAVIKQCRFQILIQILEINTFFQRLITCRIQNVIDHLVQQCTLVQISVLYNLLQ